MGTNCNDNGNDSNGHHWRDVGDWQCFLKDNGFLGLDFTISETYDANLTKPATKKFQARYGITGDMAQGRGSEHRPTITRSGQTPRFTCRMVATTC